MRTFRNIQLLGVLSFAPFAAIGPALGAGPAQELVLTKGGDLLEAAGELKLELAAGFLAPDMPAWSGMIPVSAAAISTLGPYEVGTTGLILERGSAVSLNWPAPGPQRVDARLFSLSLVSAGPVGFGSANPDRSWVVTAELASTDQTFGWYDLDRTSESGGTWNANLTLSLIIRFDSPFGGRSLTAGPVALNGTSNSWTRIEHSASAPFSGRGLPLGVALTGTLTSSLLDLSIAPAGEDPGRPGPGFIDSTADVRTAPGNLGRGCSIGAGAVVEVGAVIGPDAVIAAGSYVGTDSIIGEAATIGSYSVIGNRAVIDTSAVLAPGCTVAVDAVIGPNCYLGSACVIGQGAMLRGGCKLQDGCVVGSAALLEAGVKLGASVQIAPGVEIAGGARVGAGRTVESSIVLLEGLDGAKWTEELPMKEGVSPQCGSVQQDSGLTTGGGMPAGEAVFLSTSPPDPANPPPGYGGLPGDTGTDIARPSCGGTGQEYGGAYMCGWFAEQLRQKLAAMGNDTTFTCVWTKNPNWAWYKRRQDK